MGRQRKTLRDPFGNLLLPKMDYHHGAYYLRRSGNERIRLSRNFAEAVIEYGRKVAPVDSGGFNALVNAWREERLPDYAESTREDYGRRLIALEEAFKNFQVSQITPANVYSFTSYFKNTPRTANVYRNLLALVFKFGASTRWPNDNPAAKSLTFKENKKRDRYITDTEMEKMNKGALKAKDGLDNLAGPMLVAASRLAVVTAQRIGDLLDLTWSDVSEEGVYFHPAKTVNSTGVKMLIEMTPELREVLDTLKNCYSKKPSAYVIHTLKGGQYTYSGFQSNWRRARDRAGLTNTHIHDLRAKALTEIYDEKDAQSLAGHSSPEMTAHYRKARLVQKVKPSK